VTIKLAATSQTAIDGQLKGSYDITSADYVDLRGQRPAQEGAAAHRRGVVLPAAQRPDAASSRRASGVESVKQLRQKTVSLNAPNDIGTLLVDSLLTDHGVPLSSVNFNNKRAVPECPRRPFEGKGRRRVRPRAVRQPRRDERGHADPGRPRPGRDQQLPDPGRRRHPVLGARQPETRSPRSSAPTRKGQELADTNRSAVEAAVEKFLGLPPLAAALVSLPSFPAGVDAVRLQRLVDAMVRFGLLNKRYFGLQGRPPSSATAERLGPLGARHSMADFTELQWITTREGTGSYPI